MYVYERRVGFDRAVTYLKCLVGDQQLVTRNCPCPFFIDIIIAFVILIGVLVMQDYEIIPKGGKSKKPGKTSKDKDKSGEKSSKSEKHGRKEKKHKRYELVMLRE